MLIQVFTEMIIWFFTALTAFVENGGYLGMALLLFPFLRKVCYLFKQLTN